MLSIVTGASRGIGYSLVRELSRREGHLVIAVSRNPRTLSRLVSKDNTHNVLPLKADITTAAGRRAVAATLGKLGRKADILVNNAGLLIKQTVERVTEKQLQAVYQANVFAPLLLIQALLPVMRKNAHVVNISSMGGVQGSAKFPGLSAYSSSKGALNVLTECLAEELKGKHIAVNCLALGTVQTEMLAAAFPGYKAPLGPSVMAAYIADFAISGGKYFNGKIIPVSSTTP